MGTRGPMPHRSEEVKGHHRRNAESKVSKGVAKKVTKPRADSDWCHFARYVYDAFGKSGISEYAQNTDWAMAWLLAENVNHYLKDNRRSSMAMSEIRQMMSALSYTEGDRRRIGIELDDPKVEEEDQGLAGVIDARERLAGKKAN